MINIQQKVITFSEKLFIENIKKLLFKFFHYFET